MSGLPPEATRMLSARIAKQKEFKEGKSIEMSKLAEGEWAQMKPEWSKHFDLQKTKPYESREPFIDKYGACILLLISKPFNPKRAKNGRYYESFEYLLMCEDSIELKKYIALFDNKDDLFEEWYFRDGKPLVKIAFVRGHPNIKYRDLGDESTWGIYLDKYLEQKDKTDISELNASTYERLFQLNLWELLEVMDAGVD